MMAKNQSKQKQQRKQTRKHEEEEDEDEEEEAEEEEEAAEAQVAQGDSEATESEGEEEGAGEATQGEAQGGRWSEKRRMRRRARAMRRARRRERAGPGRGTQELDGAHAGADARAEAERDEAADEAASEAETEAEAEEAAEDAADAEEEEEVLGFAASCEQLLRASRDEALGRCIGKGAKGRNRKPVRVVAGAIFGAIQAPGIVEALAANGTKLSSLVDASDSHIAAELVSRWPERLRDDDVCVQVWERLVKTSDGWCGEGQALHNLRRRSGGPRVAAWVRALRWAASVGFRGWEERAEELLQAASEACALEQLLAALRQVDDRSTEPRRQPPRRGAHENRPEPSEGRDAREAPAQRKERRKASSAEELPPALRALLVRRHGADFGAEGGAAHASTSGRGSRAAGRRRTAGSGRARVEELDAASMPLAQLAVAPVWLGSGPEVRALHARLRALAKGSRHAEGGRLRVGVDTEWADAAADEPSIPEPSAAAARAASASVAVDTTRRMSAPHACVAVVQVAVSDQVWVLDALAAGPETGALLRWALACEEVAVLGFAFSGDLAVLRPLCGGGELCASSLVDVQTLAMRPGEDTPSLRRVCARTIGLQLDKTQQCSDWARRPLEQEQIVYAALDAHILLQVYEALLARE